MVVGEFACQYEIRQIRTLKPHISLRCQEVVLKLNALSLVWWHMILRGGGIRPAS